MCHFARQATMWCRWVVASATPCACAWRPQSSAVPAAVQPPVSQGCWTTCWTLTGTQQKRTSHCAPHSPKFQWQSGRSTVKAQFFHLRLFAERWRSSRPDEVQHRITLSAIGRVISFLKFFPSSKLVLSPADPILGLTTSGHASWLPKSWPADSLRRWTQLCSAGSTKQQGLVISSQSAVLSGARWFCPVAARQCGGVYSPSLSPTALVQHRSTLCIAAPVYVARLMAALFVVGRRVTIAGRCCMALHGFSCLLGAVAHHDIYSEGCHQKRPLV
mmetsp:Transcript_6071/g.17375  ORF Transcript_6071/g.17375 Transcript_6071/m.17375 type:complete len:274 (+) Transcript_6071:1639-2460(+)